MARRRLLAALCAGGAVAAGLQAASAPPEPLTPVVVARADLPGGRSLRAVDLSTVPFRAGALPDGLLGSAEAAVGRVLAAPLRRGEPVTDVRLVGPGLLDGYPGLVAAPVRIADAGTVALVKVGDRVDLVAADPERGGAGVVARGVPVVALPRVSRERDGFTAGGLIVVAVSADDAVRLAELALTSVLSVVLTS